MGRVAFHSSLVFPNLHMALPPPRCICRLLDHSLGSSLQRPFLQAQDWPGSILQWVPALRSVHTSPKHYPNLAPAQPLSFLGAPACLRPPVGPEALRLSLDGTCISTYLYSRSRFLAAKEQASVFVGRVSEWLAVTKEPGVERCKLIREKTVLGHLPACREPGKGLDTGKLCVLGHSALDCIWRLSI